MSNTIGQTERPARRCATPPQPMSFAGFGTHEFAAHAFGAHGSDAIGGATPTQLARRRSFHTLDALRGIAALSVVFVHAAVFYSSVAPQEGQLAVDLFFVMSGFIIAYRYDDDLDRGLGLARFVGLRLIRLYPLFLLGMVLGLGAALLALMAGDPLQKGLVDSFPLAILMLPSRHSLAQTPDLYPLNYVAWSLVLEIAINVAYAATFRFWTARRLGVLLGAAFVGLCLCLVVYGGLKDGYTWDGVPVGVSRIVFGFSAGVLICRAYRRGRIAMRVHWAILLLLATALFLFDAPVSHGLWELVAITVLIPALVVAAVASEPPKALQGICAVVGLLSYAIYSLHAPFIALFETVETHLSLDVDHQTSCAAVVFTILLAALCIVAHLLYDRPLRRVLSARMQGRSRRRAAVAPPQRPLPVKN